MHDLTSQDTPGTSSRPIPLGANRLACSECGRRWGSLARLEAHAETHRPIVTVYGSQGAEIRRTRTSLNGFLCDFRLTSSELVIHFVDWLTEQEELVSRVVRTLLTSFLLRARIVCRIWFRKMDLRTGEVLRYIPFHISSYSADYERF